MKNSKILPYIEGAVVIAMGIVLSFINIYKLPWGGSITLLGMLPVSLYSIRYGVKKGLCISFLFSVFQFFQGIADGLLAWGLTPVMLISCILLDYIFAYTSIGAAGIFRKKGVSGWIIGITLALFIRFICHFISGVVIFHSVGMLWDGFSTNNTYIYSLIYNGSYMLPEIIFTCIGAAVIFRVPVIQKLIMSSNNDK